VSAISPRDLLAQARDLATRDPLKPKQASLRRAVSTAYYALFHLLVTAASQSLGRGSAPLSRLLARAFDHSEMEKACGTFAAGGAMPQAVTGAYGPIVVPPELRRVAQAFRDLQEARHDADYGTDRVWTKTEAITEVERAEQAFQDWSAIHRRAAAAPVVRLFLAWLGFQKKLQAR
jgi:uncharacterized protein (UPF0332 family)